MVILILISFIHTCIAGILQKFPVAFSARPIGGRYYTCPSWEVGIFDKVITDTSKGFDPASSSFTCPVSGTYMFTLTAANKDGYDIECEIFVESFKYANIANDNYPNQVSNAVIVPCLAGQRVWIRVDCRADFGLKSGAWVIFFRVPYQLTYSTVH